MADPRQLTDSGAQKLMAEGKPIYWADGSIHSPETGSPEMLMELAYRLVVEGTPFIQKIRKDSLVMITAVVEVDGRHREVDIYMVARNTPTIRLTPSLGGATTLLMTTIATAWA